MVKRRGQPTFGELVVCRITKVNQNSCECHLEEYDKEGLCHISEVSSGWVRDIRSFVKVGQQGVAKVIRVEGNNISLSFKRVDRKQENDKIKEYKLNQRAEKLLEIAAKKLNKTLEKAYEEVGFSLLEKFPSMYEAFREAATNPDLLKRRGIPDQWISAIKEVAEKSIEQKEFTFSARLKIRSYKPNGIVVIKEVLRSAEKAGLDVHYIAAPNYMVKYKTLQAKKGHREFEEKLEKVASSTKDAEISYEISSS